MFGKRKTPVPAQSPSDTSPGHGGGLAARTGGGGPGNPSSGDNMPWGGDPSFVACNLASGNLANNLASWVAYEDEVHAETYVAASGAIAGYAARQSFAVLDPDARMDAFTSKAGRQYLFGDALNNMLFARSDAEAAGRVWPRAAGAAVSIGLPQSQLPSLDEMFRHVVTSVCSESPLEGRPSTGPDHQPIVAARELLALYWPHVMRLLSADVDAMHRRFGPVPPQWWFAVAAYATARPIIDVKDVLDPATALTILMESAIYSSKLTSL
jgi:hypothetical protein